MAASYGVCFRFTRNLLKPCSVGHNLVVSSIKSHRRLNKLITHSECYKLPQLACFRCYTKFLYLLMLILLITYLKCQAYFDGEPSTLPTKASYFGSLFMYEKILNLNFDAVGQSSTPHSISGTAMSNEEKEEEENLKATRDANWRTMKYSLIALGSMFGIFGSYIVYTLGTPPIDDDGNVMEDEFSSLPEPVQTYKRLIKELAYYNMMIKKPSRDKLLPDPFQPPYVQPKFTLVLEMNDLLVHPEWTYQTGWRFKKRPGVDKFLEQVGMPLYELVVFTADAGMTVFPILNALDPNGCILYRLVRDSTDFVDGHHVKNLDWLNRDLSKVIVIDWNPNSVKFHRPNALIIPRWNGSDDDTTLIDLAAFLRTVAASEVEDIRDVLTYYSQFEDPIEAFRENQRKILEQIEENEERERKKQQALTTKWSGSFFKKSLV